jgi:hypothetical protein
MTLDRFGSAVNGFRGGGPRKGVEASLLQLLASGQQNHTRTYSSTMAAPSSLSPLFRLSRRHVFRQIRYSSSEALQSPLSVRNVPAPYFGCIRILSLNRPQARNALSRELLDRLKQEIFTIRVVIDQSGAGNSAENVPRALILASEIDNCFCAGADLKERLKFTKEEYTFRM